MSEPTLAADFMKHTLAEFRRYKSLADRAFGQVNDDEFFALLDPEANSIAILVKHLAGNMRSRWTDFLTSDGEKPDRLRDEEFIIRPADTRPALMARWEANWQLLFSTLDGLTSEDLSRTIYIRGEPHSVVQAIQRQVAHYAYHVGQIVLLAKHFRSSQWQSLSIPRGGSDAFNDKMSQKEPAQVFSQPPDFGSSAAQII